MSRYQEIIREVFLNAYKSGDEVVEFERDDLVECAEALGVALPKNLGDLIYSVRYRTSLPPSITGTAKEGQEWVILGAGRAKYEFRLVKINRVRPNPNLITTKIPDATPEIVRTHKLADEQALLARVRYNRLIDIFLGVTAYSLQNHLRTTVAGIGQIEIDEIYAAVDKHGRQFILPVQAKGGSDQLSIVQTNQDVRWCMAEHEDLICRPISAQFMGDGRIAMFELSTEDGEIKIVQEKQYELVQGRVSAEDLAFYRNTAGPE